MNIVHGEDLCDAVLNQIEEAVMRKILFQIITLCCALASWQANASETLAQYVGACETQLGFQSSNIPNTIDCYADLFAPSSGPNDPVNDYMGYLKVTDQVDLVFACRWLFGDRNNRQNAVSVELMLHNRVSGNTCYFSALNSFPGDGQIGPVAMMVSPASSSAASYWAQPADVDASARCIGCHISGPYIATPRIAPFLAKYGLLNNGHDTGSSITNSDLTSTFNKAHVKYHAVVTPNVASVFSPWDSLKQSYMQMNPSPSDSACSQGCHIVGTGSPQQDITKRLLGPETILADPENELTEIFDANVMAPYDEVSDYRWINISYPVTGSSGVDSETFANAKNASTTLVPKLLSSCVDPATNNPGVPAVMEAHVVGSENQFTITQPGRFTYLQDRLSKFNLKDGLVCLNSDQDPGQTCADYSVHYECTDANNNKTWTNWVNHARTSDGDHEERPANVCPSGSTATSIEASFVAVNGWTYSSIGPNDRLANFSQYGLTCNNSDQPDGKCSNYVVRYSSCGPAPQTLLGKTLTNEYATGKQLTAASGSLAKGQGHNNSWNTQQWSIEPVQNTEYVRLHNPGTNVYLTVTSTAEQATVGTAASNSTTSEMWLIESVTNSSDIRLKNLYSGKYLTMADPRNFPNTPDYLPIYSQTRNTSWTSQRWIVQ